MSPGKTSVFPDADRFAGSAFRTGRDGRVFGGDVPGAEVVTPLRVLDIIVWYAHHPSPNQAVRRRHAFEQAGLDAEDAESAITRA